MPLQKLTTSQQKSLIIATGIALLASVWFLKAYILLILLSAVVVVLFNPLYHWLMAKGLKPGSAASVTLLVSVLSVIIPVIIVSSITFIQIQNLIDTISKGSYSQDISEFIGGSITFANQTLDTLGLTYRLSIGSITQGLSSTLENIGNILVSGLFSSVSSIFGFITTAIVFIYVFLSMIVKQNTILQVAKKLNPLGDEISDLYVERIHAMTKATVRGQFIIAVCQGIASAAVLALTGLHDLFFFFLVLITVLSIVPLGAGIVTIPIGIIMIVMGNVWQGTFVLANHFVVVTNIDNVLRPRLVPPEAKLDSALMILAVFAGLGMFGFFGIILGPVLMIILVTTIQVYLAVFKDTPLHTPVAARKKRTITRRLRSAFHRT